MKRVQVVVFSACLMLTVTIGFGQGQGANRMTAEVFKGLELRGLGPTLSTGRVADVEVDPNNPTRYFVASAVGGLWKSDNRGNTWRSVFDNGGSFNLCCVVVDPKNSDIVWLGTGENSNPRSSTYGDGLYKSTDGGETFTRIGLETSEHIGNIKIDPRNSDVVYVAVQGPLWSAGGDRGVYKTTDGGRTWKAVLTVSADTGANEVVIDPNNPDVLYASMWQRRRAVGQMIGGGPESGLFKSTNGGGTWTKLTRGLPTGDVGRIALGVDPKAKPTRVYALLNGLTGESGFFRSDDAGANFERMGAPYGKPGAPAPDAGAARGATPPAGAAGAGAAGAGAAATRATTRRSSSIRFVPTPSGRRTRISSGAATAAIRGPVCPISGACTSTFTTSGPIRKTSCTSWSPTTAARTSHGMKARPGGTSTTCRSRSSIASRSTTRCRSTTCVAARRITNRSAARRDRSIASACA